MIQDIGEIEDLSERLTQDSSGEFKRDYLDGLSSMKAQIQGAVNRGVSPEEFTVANEVIKAFEQAQKVIESFWLVHHPS